MTGEHKHRPVIRRMGLILTAVSVLALGIFLAIILGDIAYPDPLFAWLAGAGLVFTFAAAAGWVFFALYAIAKDFAAKNVASALIGLVFLAVVLGMILWPIIKDAVR